MKLFALSRNHKSTTPQQQNKKGEKHVSTAFHPSSVQITFSLLTRLLHLHQFPILDFHPNGFAA